MIASHRSSIAIGGSAYKAMSDSTLRILDLPIRSVALMVAVAPLAVSRNVIQPMWDDALFFDRATCVNRAAYELSPRGIDLCLGSMFKSPVMALLLLPFGPVTNQITELGVAAFALAVVTFGLAIWMAWLTFKAGVPLLGLLAAAAAIRLCGPIATADAPFFADGAFALIVGIATLLPLVEYGSPAVEPRAAVLRGLMWGIVAGLGALTKINFGVFGIVIAPMILIVSAWRTGLRPTLLKSAAASLVCVIPGLMYVRYGPMYFKNGWQSSYGGLAQLYGSTAPSPWKSLLESVVAAGYPFWIVCGALLLVAAIRGRRDLLRLALGVTMGAMALAYLVAASNSVNLQPRYIWPVWMILPIALASAIAPADNRAKKIGRLFAVPLLSALAILWSLPMLSRFDFQMVRQADELLRSLSTDRPIRLEITTDTPFFNIQTLKLAQQVDWNALKAIEIREVVYDLVFGRTPEFSEQQIRAADFVVMSWPIAIPPAPEFTNRFVSRFLATAQACGKLVVDHPGPPDTLLFNMHSSPCPSELVR